MRVLSFASALEGGVELQHRGMFRRDHDREKNCEGKKEKKNGHDTMMQNSARSKLLVNHL